MGLFDSVTGKVSVDTSEAPAAPTSSEVAGSGDRILTVGGNKIDPSFLDSLYNGGKLTAAARENILNGGDVTIYGLSAYDLYYLTCGRLGAKTSPVSCFAVVPTFSANATYTQGQIVQYQPTGARTPGLYQVTAASVPAGTLPTNIAYFVALIPAGPVVLYEAELQNPALSAVSAAGASILAQQNTTGTALPAFIVPAGRSYRFSTSDVRPAIRNGSTLPVDAHLWVEFTIVETLNQDGTTTVAMTPRWVQIATGNNAAINLVTAATLAARVCIELI